MKYFYDTEFIDDGNTIDLISIGIVREDGREFYAVSNEFDPDKASQWVKDNVLNQLSLDSRRWWLSRNQMKERILEFVGEDEPELWAYYAAYDHVALSQLFGRMMDLPHNFPLYTNDLKQLIDQRGAQPPIQEANLHHALSDARWVRDSYYWLMQRA